MYVLVMSWTSGQQQICINPSACTVGTVCSWRAYIENGIASSSLCGSILLALQLGSAQQCDIIVTAKSELEEDINQTVHTIMEEESKLVL